MSQYQFLSQEPVLYPHPEAMPLLELMALAGRSNKSKFRSQILKPLIELGIVELTIPGKPTSSNQKYRLSSRYRGGEVST